MNADILPLELENLLHPAKAFAHPRDVVRAPGLTLQEKRVVLASWASDACAVEAAPELRTTPGGLLVKWDDIMDALHELDSADQPRAAPDAPAWRPWRRRGGGSGNDHSYAE